MGRMFLLTRTYLYDLAKAFDKLPSWGVYEKVVFLVRHYMRGTLFQGTAGHGVRPVTGLLVVQFI